MTTARHNYSDGMAFAAEAPTRLVESGIKTRQNITKPIGIHALNRHEIREKTVAKGGDLMI